ncbi:lytic transglycosylase domain-containing protein [Rhizobium grahamii]|uniref:Lytic transglycosylase domain-containing protein n=2 Tax=Rhizobium grahamii TaxID=1120045 RepID=A0A5Q0BZF7_9HYPH|nr:lytic transglycosylase domain-containing protein [Rhizobium grahamii]QFY59008.1 lytic transglycosylase domain-containing protein [Rhizobium grahamii]
MTTCRVTRLAVALISIACIMREPEVARAEPGDIDAACLYSGNADDGATLCIRKDHFNADLCEVIDRFATSRNLPPAFFARLIWRESLFRPEAVSPKGAEGIAQFMPATARRRALENSFDVVKALDASSRYLDELRIRFGNLGLAAAAYNAGEAGLSRFLASGRLPIETRDYVFAITGHIVEAWRDNPPENAAPALQEGKPFRDACITLAETRQMNDPVLAGSADWAPWGVQLAAHYNPAVADRLFLVSLAKLPAPLNAQRALIVRQRGGNFGYRPRYAARIGQETRGDATKLCGAIRAAGVPCTVFRNR